MKTTVLNDKATTGIAQANPCKPHAPLQAFRAQRQYGCYVWEIHPATGSVADRDRVLAILPDDSEESQRLAALFASAPDVANMVHSILAERDALRSALRDLGDDSMNFFGSIGESRASKMAAFARETLAKGAAK